MNRREALLAAVPLLVGTPGARAATAPALSDDALAARLRSGQVALLLRHSITDPGIGDPPGFTPGVCATQRNLSAEGRAKAQRIGAWFKARSLEPSQVRSSAWCRCLDTATLAFGKVTPWEPLNSFFDDTGTRERQTAVLAAALPGIGAGRFEVWITHQVNITAVTGEFVQMGEAWLVTSAAAGAPIRVLGRFSPSG